MKTFGSMLLGLSLILLSILGTIGFIADYKYERNVISYWNLAEKASTIEKKSEYIDLFVQSIDKAKYYDQYNAIFLKTPDNSFIENMTALKSFQNRLHEIKLIPVSSFEYQTAIQQITAQEQGEAYTMLCVFEGIWYKENFIYLWDWVRTLIIGICIVGGAIGVLIIVIEN